MNFHVLNTAAGPSFDTGVCAKFEKLDIAPQSVVQPLSPDALKTPPNPNDSYIEWLQSFYPEQDDDDSLDVLGAGHRIKKLDIASQSKMQPPEPKKPSTPPNSDELKTPLNANEQHEDDSFDVSAEYRTLFGTGEPMPGFDADIDWSDEIRKFAESSANEPNKARDLVGRKLNFDEC